MEKETKISVLICSSSIYLICFITNNVNQFNVDKQIPVQAVEMPGSMNDNLDVQVSALYTTDIFEPKHRHHKNLIVLTGFIQSTISVLIDFKCYHKYNS